MHADVERLRSGHGELVEIGAHHDAAAERALVGIEHEALRRIGAAGEDFCRQIVGDLRRHPHRVGREPVIVPAVLQRRVDLDDAAGAVAGERRAGAGGAGGEIVDIGVGARLERLVEQAVEHQRVGRVVARAQRGRGLRAGGIRGDHQRIDGGDGAEHFGAGRAPEPGIADARR